MDNSKIMEMAKARGLSVAEDAVMELAELAIDVMGEIIKGTPNKYDDMIFAALEGKARDQLKELADKIDGKEG